MNEAERQSPAPKLDESEVAAFLQSNPDFLQRYPAVLESLDLTHDSGTAVSLIERQVTRLRDSNRQIQARFNELIETARANEERVVQLNRLAKVLVAAESLPGMVPELTQCLQRHFDVDRVYIGLSGEAGDIESLSEGEIRAVQDDSPAGKALTNVYRRGKPICGPLSETQSEALFATRSNDDPVLASAAMIPLGKNGVRGALVLASHDPARFVADIGTLFLELMGDLVTVGLERLIEPDAMA